MKVRWERLLTAMKTGQSRLKTAPTVVECFIVLGVDAIDMIVGPGLIKGEVVVIRMGVCAYFATVLTANATSRSFLPVRSARLTVGIPRRFLC